jgi:hypothetical protein
MIFTINIQKEDSTMKRGMKLLALALGALCCS